MVRPLLLMMLTLFFLLQNEYILAYGNFRLATGSDFVDHINVMNAEKSSSNDPLLRFIPVFIPGKGHTHAVSARSRLAIAAHLPDIGILS
jgi:hypothetical protein